MGLAFVNAFGALGACFFFRFELLISYVIFYTHVPVSRPKFSPLFLSITGVSSLLQLLCRHFASVSISYETASVRWESNSGVKVTCIGRLSDI